VQGDREVYLFELKGENVEIRIDVTDWAEEYAEIEPNLMTFEQAVDSMLSQGVRPQQMARLLAVAKEREETYDEVSPPKPMLLLGYTEDWLKQLKRAHEDVTLESGKQITVNRFVGTVRTKDSKSNGIQTPVEWDNPVALERAVQYLRDVVPGHIYGRLKLIVANGGDKFGMIAEMHDMLDELSARLP
jgi:hypothetical protein